MATRIADSLHDEWLPPDSIAEESTHAGARVEIDVATFERPGEQPEVDLWTAAFEVGEGLPLMPLGLTSDLFVPIDFAATYQEACRPRRLAWCAATVASGC